MADATPMIYVVDDEEPVRKALSRLLRSAGYAVSTYGSAREFLQASKTAAPGCLLLDMAMPELDGLELQRELAEKHIGLPVIFLTARASIPMTVQAMKRGAHDFLTKPVNDEKLLGAVRSALERDLLRREAEGEQDEIRTRLASLSPRQLEVMHQVLAGKLNKQIAAALGRAERTVKIHRHEVMRKMQAESVAELVRLVGKAGLQPGPPSPVPEPPG